MYLSPHIFYLSVLFLQNSTGVFCSKRPLPQFESDASFMLSCHHAEACVSSTAISGRVGAPDPLNLPSINWWWWEDCDSSRQLVVSLGTRSHTFLSICTHPSHFFTPATFPPFFHMIYCKICGHKFNVASFFCTNLWQTVGWSSAVTSLLVKPPNLFACGKYYLFVLKSMLVTEQSVWKL